MVMSSIFPLIFKVEENPDKSTTSNIVTDP